MAVSDVEAVLEFLRKNGFSESESALMEDIIEKSELRSFDFEKFLFPMIPPPPPLKIPSATRMPSENASRAGVEVDSTSDSSEDEFVSLGSSTSDVCSSEFTNPYGAHTATGPCSEASSDMQFGTARDYHDFDMQNDPYWYGENDEDFPMPPYFGDSDPFAEPSEDKFVMTQETEKHIERQLDFNPMTEEFQSEGRTRYVEKMWPLNVASMDDVKGEIRVGDFHNLTQNDRCEGGLEKGKEGYAVYGCSGPFRVFNTRGEGAYVGDHSHYDLAHLEISDFQHRCGGGKLGECGCALKHDADKCRNYSAKKISAYNWFGDFKNASDVQTEIFSEDFFPNGNENYGNGDDREVVGEVHASDTTADELDDATAHELVICDPNEDEYEVFNLRIIHRRNRTGFEENKDFPIVLNSIIAGRYYVTEYLGSAAFSKAVEAHDILMGTDVCLKIIKNDKDFFDQSLDEIKLLKFVNKHDPGDERHILRLYDYFYHQEHLFIVTELLQANLYEFQKYNGESGGEPYFTLARLQCITRQCLEALEYLRDLGIIHCDLKPENILIKSYRRCEIKIIDLGSSCFQTDNLCLYVQSRSYRAPEVILGLPYDQKIDLWSLGCILAELYSGEVLFPNEDIVMLLARMMGMLGPIDMDMLMRGQETEKYFTKEYDLYHINEETNQLEYIIPEESSLEHHLQASDIVFVDFLRSLLEINPQRRPTAREALEHPWLSHSYECNSF